MASSQHLNISDFCDSLDIPDSDWNDVDDAPQSRRHTKVQRWNGAHYQPTSLMDLGFLWHIGHGGDLCPCNWSDPDPEESGYVTGDGPPNHRKSSWFQMTIVHTEGIFSHEVSVCKCPGSDPNDWHLDLLHQRLFPASISKPKTAFTFDVLDHFLIDALECKTSAMGFYQKLKRFTNNAFPERDRYRELMRVSWLWRDLKHRKWFGFGHDTGKDPGDGGLALFCPACPQPGLNLPADWKVWYDRDTVMRQYVIDGNFTAQHMKMNKLELDVALSDGKGYMVSEGPYQNHLQQSLDTKEMRGFKGASRVKNSPSLLLPPALEIVPAVGRFHLAAHKLSCFPRYSLNFVKGAGHLGGEILETLQEVYDDHMRDSNWKKLVGLVPSLLKKYKTSNKCLEEMNQAYEQLTAVLDPYKVSGWELDALRAEADRGEALDIYLLKGNKAPTVGMQLQLMRNPKSPSGSGGSVTWLAKGISIEDSQDQLRFELQQLPNPMSTSQEVKISEKRQRLSARIEKFHSNGQEFFKAFCGKEEEEEEDREFWDEDEGYWGVPEEEVEEVAYELMSIWMPSSIGSAKLTELGLVDLLKEERELRIGQANDCLDQLRTDLGNKAMLYQ
ncbi:hypothetical protein EV401DRAFT_2072574 [Pisolithus croceorrhizus]|nr:hypothetical protein EV401DRAFT_2072574 [Pisolithus croceorrhizus]